MVLVLVFVVLVSLSVCSVLDKYSRRLGLSGEGRLPVTFHFEWVCLLICIAEVVFEVHLSAVLFVGLQ